jgi:hypothetical protein
LITAQRALQMALGVGNVPLEIAAYRVWQAAAALAGLDTQEPASQLRKRIQALRGQTRKPEFLAQLAKMQESVDRI